MPASRAFIRRISRSGPISPQEFVHGSPVCDQAKAKGIVTADEPVFGRWFVSIRAAVAEAATAVENVELIVSTVVVGVPL